MWRYVKEKRNVMESKLKNVSTKNRKKWKRLVSRLKALFLLKSTFYLYFGPEANSDEEKESFLKFSFFEGTPRP